LFRRQPSWSKLEEGMLHRAVVGIAAAATVAMFAPGVAGAAPHYYLSLGDSLSQGVQPNAGGKSVETGVGYADQLYASMEFAHPALRLVKLGCPGESSASMVTGRGNPGAAVFGCHPAGGTQLKAALRFLGKHHKAGEVPLITIDIGANDIDNCVPGGKIDFNCVTAGEKAIAVNVPKIVKALRMAAAKGTKIIGMTFYDPFLAGYLLGGDAAVLAQGSVALAKTVNDTIAKAFKFHNGRVADVATAFKTYDSTDMAALPNGKTVPMNVAQICTLTWQCTKPPQGPNIHANTAGYTLIEQTFAQVMGKLKFA
jgi:lysophospholipase L1-like esterase